MPTFEFTTKDNRVFQLDAPDQATAIQKWQQAQPQISPPRPQPPSGSGVISQGLSGVNEGVANTIGLPVDLANRAIGLGMQGVNALTGSNLQPSQEPVLGSDYWKRVMGSPVPGTNSPMIAPPTDVPADAFARTAGRGFGATATAALTGGASIPASLAMGAGSGIGGATGGALTKDNPWGIALGEMLGGGGVIGAEAGLAKRAAQRTAEAGVPTVDELTSRAGGLYDQAEANGITATQQQTTALRDTVHQLAADEGLISPTGRVANSYPKVADALNMIDDYAKGTMTPTQMKAVRKTLQNAAQSAEPAERRVGTMMLKEFDQFVAPLAPEFQQANALYTRAMRGSDLELLRDLAASRAGQFTGSGFENALRTEYRGLERKIIKGQERGWSPDEQQAITHVAQGTPTANVFRNVGRLAPTGPVSFGASIGLPYAIGTNIGGPEVGAAASAATALAGYGSRVAAARIGSRNAQIAEILARNGMPVNPASVTPQMARLAEALMAGTVANAQSQ